MKITRKDLDENVSVLYLSGKLMGGPDADKLRNLIRELIEHNRQYVVLNLKKIDWMNSSGLGILISTHTSLINAGGMSVMCNLSDKVKSLLMITKLEQVLAVYRTERDAINALRLAAANEED